MPSGLDLLDLYTAYAAWEAVDPEVLALYPTFRAFQTYPEAADVNAGVLPPYTCHGSDSGQFAPRVLDPSIDSQTHFMYTIFVYARKGLGDLAKRERDAATVINLYRRSWLLHLRLTDKNVDLARKVMTYQKVDFKLMNNREIGIQFTWPVDAIQELPTGQ